MWQDGEGIYLLYSRFGHFTRLHRSYGMTPHWGLTWTFPQSPCWMMVTCRSIHWALELGWCCLLKLFHTCGHVSSVILERILACCIHTYMTHEQSCLRTHSCMHTCTHIHMSSRAVLPMKSGTDNLLLVFLTLKTHTKVSVSIHWLIACSLHQIHMTLE